MMLEREGEEGGEQLIPWVINTGGGVGGGNCYFDCAAAEDISDFGDQWEFIRYYRQITWSRAIMR